MLLMTWWPASRSQLFKCLPLPFSATQGTPPFRDRHFRPKSYYRGAQVWHVQRRGNATVGMHSSSACFSVRLDTVFPFRTTVVNQLLRQLLLSWLYPCCFNYNLYHPNESGNVYFYFKRYFYYRCSWIHLCLWNQRY